MTSSPKTPGPGLHLRGGGEASVSLLPPELIDSGHAAAQVAYGIDASVIIASRDGGYHSKPHVHPAEQINYMLTGEAWVFIEDEGFHVKAGDLLRIPADKVHWAWVKSDQPASVLEVHTPPLTADYQAGRISLLTTAEEEAQVRHIGNRWAPEFDWRSVEKRVVGVCYDE